MDSQRFDGLARALGAGASRRSIVKGIAAGLFGLGAGRVAIRSAGATDLPCSNLTGPCGVNQECCTSDLTCEGSFCLSSQGGACMNSGDCAGGLDCISSEDPTFSCDFAQPSQAAITCVCGTFVQCVVADDCIPDVSSAGALLLCCDGTCATGECCADADCTTEANGACVDHLCEYPKIPTCQVDDDCIAGAGPVTPSRCCGGVCVAAECCTDDDCTAQPNGICLDTVCEYEAEPQCEVASDCVAGAVGEGEPLCCDGTCALGECCVDGDCTDGTNGACVDNLCVYGAGCATDNDCIPAVGEAGIPPICCEGVCVSIECCMADEQTNPRCPVGTACFEGVCDPVCKGDGDCANGTCCCPDGSCDAGCCAPVDNGNGNEQPTKLPSTGSGQDDGGNGLLLGAALLGGAAAVLGGKKLREQSRE